ncbi:MAG: hypothetical protein QOD00_1808 [Blastocatellia bacterium]|nr:hypothetical protein [Blastocatellia bacterium]
MKSMIKFMEGWLRALDSGDEVFKGIACEVNEHLPRSATFSRTLFSGSGLYHLCDEVFDNLLRDVSFLADVINGITLAILDGLHNCHYIGIM